MIVGRGATLLTCTVVVAMAVWPWLVRTRAAMVRVLGPSQLWERLNGVGLPNRCCSTSKVTPS